MHVEDEMSEQRLASCAETEQQLRAVVFVLKWVFVHKFDETI